MEAGSSTIWGTQRGSQILYKINFPKTQRQWVAKPIKEKKSFSHVEGLMADVVHAWHAGRVDHKLHRRKKKSPQEHFRDCCTKQTRTYPSTQVQV